MTTFGKKINNIIVDVRLLPSPHGFDLSKIFFALEVRQNFDHTEQIDSLKTFSDE